MKKLCCLFQVLLFATITFSQTPALRIVSPDKKTTFEVGLSNGGKLCYRMILNGREVLQWSALGFQLNNIEAGANTVIGKKSQHSFYSSFDWRLGENARVDNRYASFSVECNSGEMAFTLLGRVYDSAIAFRYKLPEDVKQGILTKEFTEFQLPADYTIYQYHQESEYKPVRVDTFNAGSDLPSTLTNGNNFIVIGEAMNENYNRMELRRSAKPHGLTLTLSRDSVIQVTDNFLTPWRTVAISRTAIGLHAFSELNLKLNPAHAAGIPSWIKPGKLIRSQLTTQSGLDCIDFAAKHDLQYIMFDAGWYGAEFRGSSDPAVVIPAIDMPGVIAYGKEKNIGVILYVNYVGLKAKLDTILPLYKRWGVAGLKFGFVDGITQQGIIWLKDAVAKASAAGFIIDVHDNYKPTGWSGTFPALLTQEGIRGNENSPDAFHNTTLPFTRFLSGAADYTFCYPNATNRYEQKLKVSMGQQLALTVIYFSPLQAMFWYGIPTEYKNEQEIEFFKYVPTVWERTIYLDGAISKGISVARKSGKNWYVGSAAGLEDWNSALSFQFLQAGKSYTASLFEDDGQNSIRKKTFRVKRGDLFPVQLKAKGGLAMVLVEN